MSKDTLQQSCVTYNCRSLSSAHPLLIPCLSSAYPPLRHYVNHTPISLRSLGHQSVRFQSDSNQVPMRFQWRWGADGGHTIGSQPTKRRSRSQKPRQHTISPVWGTISDQTTPIPPPILKGRNRRFYAWCIGHVHGWFANCLQSYKIFPMRARKNTQNRTNYLRKRLQQKSK